MNDSMFAYTRNDNMFDCDNKQSEIIIYLNNNICMIAK